MQKPKSLTRGDLIGLVSPSAPLAGLVPHRTKNGLRMLEKMGFRILMGKSALKVSSYTAGTAKERAQDINEFFDNPEVMGIFSFIGGNHSNQLLKYLDFESIKRNPKVFLGYSDATVLHFAFHTQAELVSFYGPAVLTQFAENPEIFLYTKEYFEKATMSSKPIGKILPSSVYTDEILDWFKQEDLTRPRKIQQNNRWLWLKEGEARGPILGGCISSMMHLRGTAYWPDFKDSILFFEIPESVDDFKKGEKPETVDAYISDLELSGVFNQIKGLVIGRPFGYSERDKHQLIEIVKERMDGYNFPILFNFDIGHTDPMITIPLGVEVQMDSENNIFQFLESATI